MCVCVCVCVCVIRRLKVNLFTKHTVNCIDMFYNCGSSGHVTI